MYLQCIYERGVWVMECYSVAGPHHSLLAPRRSQSAPMAAATRLMDAKGIEPVQDNDVIFRVLCR